MRAVSCMASPFPIGARIFPVEIREITMEMQTFPLQARDIALESRSFP